MMTDILAWPPSVSYLTAKFPTTLTTKKKKAQMVASDLPNAVLESFYIRCRDVELASLFQIGTVLDGFIAENLFVMMASITVYSLIIAGAALACYINSLGCGFVFDDMSAIVDNKDLRPHIPITTLFLNDFWGTPMHKEKSHKSYRPLCVLTFRLNYMLSELEPMTYHAVNILLHAVVCVLLLRVYRMFLSEWTSFIGALLFAVHPIHTEAVAGVVGRAESLSALFFLLAMLSYANSTSEKRSKHIAWPSLLITVCLIAVAMLCKEQGITVIGVCCVYELFVAQKATFAELVLILKSFVSNKPHIPAWLKTSMLRAGFLVVTSLLLLIARIKVMGAQLPVFTRYDNPASVAATPSRQLTYNYLLSLNTWLLLFPAPLCCDWTMGTIPLIESVIDYRHLATLAFYFGLLSFIKYALSGNQKSNRAVVMSLALMVLPFLPASNLFFPVGFVVAERILYTPSMGFCALVALGFEKLVNNHRKYKLLIYAGMIFLLASHSLKTVVRNFDWKSESTIFRAALRVSQNNAKLWNNVGHALEKEERYQEALYYFTKATSIQPDDMGAHINVGRTHNNLKDYAEAEQAYRHAMNLFPQIKPGKKYTARIAPNHLNVFLNLANLISKNESRLLEADQLYRTALSMREDYIQAYINRGDILIKLGRPDEARQLYVKALTIEEDNSDVHYNIGVLDLEDGKKLEALQHFTSALQHNPDHQQSLFNSAILMQELGNPEHRPIAYSRLLKLIKLTPDDSKVYFNLGMLSTDDKKFDDAERWFKQAIQVQSDLRGALFNLALLLNNDLNRPLEAEPYLEALLQYYPDHIKGLTLMGDINVNVKKNLKAAEQNYKTILEYEPNNSQAYHNLCVVYVESGDLLRGEKCLTIAHNMAPEELYIKQHLNIIRGKIQQIQEKMRQQKQDSSAGQKQQTQQPPT